MVAGDAVENGQCVGCSRCSAAALAFSDFPPRLLSGTPDELPDSVRAEHLAGRLREKAGAALDDRRVGRVRSHLRAEPLGRWRRAASFRETFISSRVAALVDANPQAWGKGVPDKSPNVRERVRAAMREDP